ncbi:MAG: hypothetical protein EBZ95_14300 [Chitinophagia bacterium]|nr:hypothetical protein [Chitinophagia bacterium]
MKKAISKKHLFLILLFSFLVGDFFSQISANAGMGTLNGFGAKKTFFGFNLGLEYPKSNQTTIYGRIAYYIPRNNIDSTLSDVYAISVTTSPYSLPRNYIVSTGYLTIEGGTRYYLLNGYDNGFSIYGGSTILVCVNNIKKNYADWDYPYNEANYENYGDTKGTILNLGVGLQGGLKYTFPSIGTFFCDLSGNYLIVRQANNDMVGESTNYPFNSALLFTFNLGFRKDFY